MIHASEATRRWFTPCYQLEPRSSCRPSMVCHPCIWHAKMATRRWSALCYPGGAKVDLQIEGGFSSLHAACQHGQTAVVRALLLAGAKVDLMTEGATPLHVACQEGHVGVVHALLSEGAKGRPAHLLTTDGASPLHVACLKGNTEVVHAPAIRGGQGRPADQRHWCVTPA